MFVEMLLPLDMHCDFGFGEVGGAFETAARCVMENKSHAEANIHLPTSFLLRHSAELYLKSAIVVLHRKFRSENHRANIKNIQIGKNVLSRTHSILDLYTHFSQLIKEYQNEIMQIGKTRWDNPPPDLEFKILQIDSADRNSTYFRYPDVNSPLADREKSGVSELTSLEAFTRVWGGTPPSDFVEPDGVRIFSVEDKAAEDNMAILKDTVKVLSGVSLGIKHEIGQSLPTWVAE